MGRALAAWLMVAGALGAQASSPREVVQAAVVHVIDVLHGTDLKRPEAEDSTRREQERRRIEIRRIASELLDFDEMARRTLSRHWAGRSSAEQAEFVELFTDLLERTYVGKIEAYSGEKIVHTGEAVDGGYATVKSRIITRRRTETQLDYRLRQRDGRWKVYDVLIDGVSFVSTYRSEFDRVIRLSSYESLVDQMRQKRLDPIAVGVRRR